MNQPGPRFREIFFEVYENLPRQGPGNRACAARALGLCRDLPPSAAILDLGCGVGGQTLQLAGLVPSGSIVAIRALHPLRLRVFRGSPPLAKPGAKITSAHRQSGLACDIFCAVIDNLGDAGVCWRLARQLAAEHGWRVRLWIDDPAPIGRMAPDQTVVEVRRWAGDFGGIAAADIVIEAFACELPPAYVAAMRARPRPPVWLNLEYLSAEDWVPGCHGLPSPQPPLAKHFFFPGFAPGSGGLLREKDYAVPPAPSFAGPLEISLFCYDNPALPALLAAWRDGGRPIACHVCAGLPGRQVAAWLGTDFAAGATARRGHLTLHALPFLPQTGYDALLARCHLNFVRGEDSFVRAQWAERPFVWQAYPQAENAHFAKLDAFLNLYAQDATVRDFFHAWNDDGVLDWPAFAAQLPALAAVAPGWARQIAAHGDLATNLVRFCREKL